MLRRWVMAAALSLPATAAAGDLSDTLRFTREVMGDEAIEGYEDFIDDDPDEALALLVSRDVVPNKPPGEYAPRGQTLPPFRELGERRLGDARFSAYIAEAASESRLPAALIDALIRTESGYRPHAVSRSGAVGLTQLMPATARSVGVSDPFDPRQNILGGARYLRRMLDRFGELPLALAAYNAGPGAVARHGGIPPFTETQRYVRVVLDRYRRPGSGPR